MIKRVLEVADFAIYNYLFMLVNDCQNGNKVKSMLEVTKRQQIEVAQKQTKKGLF